MKPRSLDGMAHRTGWTISAARKVHPDPKDVGMKKASEGEIGTHADDFTTDSGRGIHSVGVCGDTMKGDVPFSLEEKGTKENIRNRQRTSREGLAREERGFIEDEGWRFAGYIRMSMKPRSLDGIAHRTGRTISAARKVYPDPEKNTKCRSSW